jgi:ABC-2 type transport system ATP-binding protein
MTGGVVLQGISKSFRHRPSLFNLLGKERRGSVRALADISLAVNPGEVLILAGPNGSGKTTLLKLVATTLLPDSGTVQVEGMETRSHGEYARRVVGLVVASERSFFPRLTAGENLDLFGALEDLPRAERRQRIDWALDVTGLEASRETLVMKFSSGMYQRLGIARALLKRPHVLLLDEPTRSLDIRGAEQLWQVFRQTARAGCTVLLATHSFEEAAALGSQIVILQSGVVRASARITAHERMEELRALYMRETQPDADTAKPAAEVGA